jgi:hypothetical protein
MISKFLEEKAYTMVLSSFTFAALYEQSYGSKAKGALYIRAIHKVMWLERTASFGIIGHQTCNYERKF